MRVWSQVVMRTGALSCPEQGRVGTEHIVRSRPGELFPEVFAQSV